MTRTSPTFRTMTLIALLWPLLASAELDVHNPLSESAEDFEKRMAWFGDARFGMFIHWGAYSVLAGEWQGKPVKGYAEWIRGKAKIPQQDYREVCTQFKPDKFDADAWIRTARDAGMKYFVITTKHHDGFCLWDSAHTDYDIKDLAGLEIDPLALLSKACRKYGVRFGTYYSILDWEVAGEDSGRSAAPPDKQAYVLYMKNQIRELIEKYDTDILWFDGDWVPWWTLEDGADLYKFIRELKPSIIINNRVSKRAQFKRDFGTPEQNTPGTDLGHDWEACWTINHSWGFKKADTKWKSTRELVQKLSDIASKGGNLLLNVGPKADGSFPQACTASLLEIGQWLKTHGEGIYGSDSSQIAQPSWGRLTRKDKALYLHIFDWPKDGQLVLEGIRILPTSATLLGDKPRELAVLPAADRLTLQLPKQPGSEPVAMVRVDFDDEPMPATTQATGNKLTLHAGDLYLPARQAVIGGQGPLQLENSSQNSDTGFPTTTLPRGNSTTSLPTPSTRSNCSTRWIRNMPAPTSSWSAARAGAQALCRRLQDGATTVACRLDTSACRRSAAAP